MVGAQANYNPPDRSSTGASGPGAVRTGASNGIIATPQRAIVSACACQTLAISCNPVARWAGAELGRAAAGFAQPEAFA